MSAVEKESRPASESRLPRSLRHTCARALSRLLGHRTWSRGYILLTSLQSFLGHVRTQFAKGRVEVDLGPLLQRHQGLPRRNTWTLARRRCIETLQAIHPWVDYQDLEIYLMGFDAGDRFASCNTAIQSDIGTDQPHHLCLMAPMLPLKTRLCSEKFRDASHLLG
jgi:hypothetical protein